MKKVIVSIALISSVLFSCKKKEDITCKKFVVVIEGKCFENHAKFEKDGDIYTVQIVDVMNSVLLKNGVPFDQLHTSKVDCSVETIK